MKRLFVLFLIVMLPLRGWAGDFMGVYMAGAQIAFQSSMAESVKRLAGMPPDCPMHAQAQQAHPGAGTADVQGDVLPDCASCSLCLPMAALACIRFESSAFVGHVQPMMADIQFVSASLAPTEEPPIS